MDFPLGKQKEEINCIINKNELESAGYIDIDICAYIRGYWQFQTGTLYYVKQIG